MPTQKDFVSAAQPVVETAANVLMVVPVVGFPLKAASVALKRVLVGAAFHETVPQTQRASLIGHWGERRRSRQSGAGHHMAAGQA
jgi:hypothetical protein